MAAFAFAGIALVLGIWAFTALGEGLPARVIARRVLGVGLLFAATFGWLGLWSWRRAEHTSRRTPEGAAGLMKVERNGEWFAETIDGRWLRWDALASDWTTTSPPEDLLLTGSRRPSVPPVIDEEAPEVPLPPEAQLALMSAEAASRRRVKRMRRSGFVARGAGSFVLGATLVLLVAGLVTLLFAGVMRFLSDLPF